jgi:sec-independent protein translocase protein TatB
MFDIGWSELLVIGVIALVAIGPKELPGAIYQLGRWVRRARAVAREFQGHIDDLMSQAEIEELRKEARKAASSTLEFERLAAETVDPDRRLATAFDLDATGAKGSTGSPVEADGETDRVAPPPVALPIAEPEPVPAPAAPSPDKTA